MLAAALSPPGEAVADWVRTAVGLRPELPTDGAPRADRPPSGGRLLVSSAGVVWIVEPDGKRRRLGAWSAASWSPHGRFVIAWKGRRLAALDRRGNVRWSLQTARPVQNAVWSPSGFRVAYRTGGELRVVAGDGTGDRSLNRASFSALAWRPGQAHVLAHTSGSHLNVLDVDSGVRLARIQLPVVSGQIAWSADGTRLYARLDRSIAVFDARGHRISRIRMPGRQTVSTFVPARSGHLVAVARRDHTSSEVALMGGSPQRRAVPRRRALQPPALLPHRPLAARRLAARRPVGLPAPGHVGRAPDASRAARDAALQRPRLPAAAGLVLPAVSSPSEVGLDPVHHRAQLLALALDRLVGGLGPHAQEVLLPRAVLRDPLAGELA